MGDPDLVWTVGDGIAGEVGEDESVVIAVGCSHEPPTPLGLRVVELFANCYHGCDDLGVISSARWRIIVGRAHQAR